ncbi:T9SS type A sorting domain-containing protein [Cryomorpha ignava]|uniref:T9SS type A sorting domain-containing protein n=1 Tax=Cryomorpha ignava TaxID=101383 RepID=A0A7K3WQT4_9FLAO|nr:M43 family zinc metalloprotease [Cryomorpha ignava]NEN23876.1 T9SS type A sorting domain-containing protein [Cryomorpha ignava]
MKKYLFSIGILFSVVSAVHSQEIDDDGTELLVKCHTYEMMDKLLEEHPELKQSTEHSAAQQAEFRTLFAKNYEKKDEEVYIIPVVFHIVHNNGVENLAPEQIENAIEVMNQDFSAQTQGIGYVNSAFTNLVSNTAIQFALAKRDPDGNCTNGIVRTESQLTYAGDDNLKMLSPVWDRSKYLNIWVCSAIESGAAGYSRYPSSVNTPYGATIDGIVVKYDYVGSIGTSSQYRSHTLTHEVGHWLDLPHLWGSTNDPEVEENCNTDDGVADTPNTIGWTNCNITGESCGSLDNVQNFMEYSYCSKMYTHGQSQRMAAALNSYVAERNELWQESNLIATGVYEDPVICAVEFTSGRRTICVGDSVQFEDYSYGGVTSRMWNFEGGSPSSSDEAEPSITYNNPGIYYVILSAGDSFETLSTLEDDYVRVLDTSLVVLPFSEGFEDVNSFENGQSPIWYTENVNGMNSWEVTDQAAYTGSQSAIINGLQSSSGEKASLLSQTFDMSYFDSTNARLDFKYSCKRKNSSSADKLIVYVSRNCGENWIARRTLVGDELYTVSGLQSTPFIPNDLSQWVEVEINNLVPVFFTSQFRIKFEFISENGNNIFLDDINLSNALTVSVNAIEAIQNAVQIYPNPARDVVKIEMDMPAGISNLEINLHDVSGRLIRSIYSGKSIGGKKVIDLDVNQLPNGLYFLHFNTSEGRFAQKFVVSK